MLKADPKPDCEATTTPKVDDDFLQTFWKGKINNTQDGELKLIQTAVLNGGAPLCGLWSQLIEQGMEKRIRPGTSPSCVEHDPMHFCLPGKC